MKTALLFFVIALAEIVGCYLPYLWLRHSKSPWLLTLHPTAAGRTYAAYGGVYVTTAIAWLWLVDGVTPDRWDCLGVGLCLTGMAVIMYR